MFRSFLDHHQGAMFLLAKVITFTVQFDSVNTVLWQHVMLCGNVLLSVQLARCVSHVT